MKKGFTLIEVLIASTLSVLICAAAYLLVMSFVRAYITIEKNIGRAESSRISLNRIVSDVRGAKMIKANSGASVLVLDLWGKEVSYDLKEGKVRRSVDGASSYLTEAGEVSHLSFSYPSQKLIFIEIASGGKRELVLSTEAFVRN